MPRRRSARLHPPLPGAPPHAANPAAIDAPPNSGDGLEEGDEPPPEQQYVPLHANPRYRREKVIYLAQANVPLAARSLARMRVYGNAGLGGGVLVSAPPDWFEYYSNIKVEAWIHMWVQAMHARVGPSMPPQQQLPPVYQHYIRGKYVIGDQMGTEKPRRQVVQGLQPSPSHCSALLPVNGLTW